VVAGRLPGDAAGRIGLAGAVAVVVVGVGFNQYAIFHHALQPAVVVVAVDVLVAAAIVQGLGFADDQAQVVVGQAVAVGGVAGYVGAEVLWLAVGIVAALLLVAGWGNGLRQAGPAVSADDKAVSLGQQQVVVVAVACGGAGVAHLVDDEVAVVTLADRGIQLAVVLDTREQLTIVGERQLLAAFADLADVAIAGVLIINGGVRRDDTAELVIGVGVGDMAT